MLKIRFLHLLELFSSKFWILPLLCLIAATATAYLNIFLDKHYFSFDATPFSFLFYFSDPQSIRALLTTTAGSLLGVAGVAFSVTLTSLVLASQQFGPRLLSNFMKDTFNQLVIGLFISTFLYCMLILQFTSNMEEAKFTPIISMVVALALLVIDLLLLVFYIHHIAESIHADTLIARVYNELIERLDKQLPELADDTPAISAPDNSQFQAIFDNNEQLNPIMAPKSGYLQAFDKQSLFSLTKDQGMVMKTHFQAGDYVMERCELACYFNPDGKLSSELEDQILNHFLIGHTRTPEQDARYAIHQLVEVALRALSPGINDPFTAITCINRLGSAMAIIMERQLPAGEYYEEDGRLRLQVAAYSFGKLLATAFDQIRQNMAYHIEVISSLLETLRQLAAQAHNQEQTDAIRDQADAIYIAIKDEIQVPKDLETVTEAYERVMEALESRSGD